MDRLKEDSWWMKLLKEKPNERHCEDLCGYRHAVNWLLDMGHVNLPKITSEPCAAWSDQWWMTVVFGKGESAEAA